MIKFLECLLVFLPLSHQKNKKTLVKDKEQIPFNKSQRNNFLNPCRARHDSSDGQEIPKSSSYVLDKASGHNVLTERKDSLKSQTGLSPIRSLDE